MLNSNEKQASQFNVCIQHQKIYKHINSISHKSIHVRILCRYCIYCNIHIGPEITLFKLFVNKKRNMEPTKVFTWLKCRHKQNRKKMVQFILELLECRKTTSSYWFSCWLDKDKNYVFHVNLNIHVGFLDGIRNAVFMRLKC